MQHIAFIGGGNMASALIGGLRRQGLAAEQIHVVEPFAPTRQQLLDTLGVRALPSPDASLSQAQLVVWAVKPQVFKEAAEQSASHTGSALHPHPSATPRKCHDGGAIPAPPAGRAPPGNTGHSHCTVHPRLAWAVPQAAATQRAQ